jgi:iron complex outermembrane receptor protein
MFTGSYYHNLDGYYAVARTGDFRWGTDETFKNRRDYSGAHVMGRWDHSFSANSDMALQIYYDHVDGTNKYDGKDSRQRQDYETDVYDIDFQHRFSCLQRHDVIWGAELKIVDDLFEKAPGWAIDPESRFEHYYSGFMQDEIEMLPDRLRLTLGSKFEYSSFCQFQAHPSIRLLWTPHSQHTVWLAVSRAVRSNIRIEHDMIIQLGSKPRYPLVSLPQRGILEIKSRSGLDAEEVIAYEIGYRMQPYGPWTLDLAAFANSFDNLLTSDDWGTMKRNLWYFTVPLYLDNTMDGRAYGVEATATWQATPAWKLQSSYTYLHFDLDPDQNDPNARTIEKLSPHHQVSLRSLIDITRQIEFDTCIYFTDRISGHDLSSYTNLTVRLGWRPLNNLELALIGANLLENRHAELFNPINNGRKSDIRRSVLGKIIFDH